MITIKRAKYFPWIVQQQIQAPGWLWGSRVGLPILALDLDCALSEFLGRWYPLPRPSATYLVLLFSSCFTCSVMLCIY